MSTQNKIEKLELEIDRSCAREFTNYEELCNMVAELNKLKAMSMDQWQKDKLIARQMLTGALEIDQEWLYEVIEDCDHRERIELREGLGAQQAPRNLYYDYYKQEWIDKQEA